MVQVRIGEQYRDIKDIWTTLKTEEELPYDVVEQNPLITAKEQDFLREELQKVDFLKKMTYCPQCFNWVCQTCFDFNIILSSCKWTGPSNNICYHINQG